MQTASASTRETVMDNLRPGGEMKSREPTEPTRSQLLPLGGAWQELVTKPYFWPGVLACLGLTALWATLSSSGLTFLMEAPGMRGMKVAVPAYYFVVGVMLTAGGAFAIYRMAGKQKAWWVMPGVVVFAAVLTESPIMTWLQVTFGLIGANRSDGSVIGGFVYNLFRAALPEEILKSIPVLIGIYIGAKLLGRMQAGHPARQLAVLEPLDGLLLGAMAGFGFAFSETLIGYVPRQMLINGDVAGGMFDLLRSRGMNLKLPSGPVDLAALIQELYKIFIASFGQDGAQLQLNRIVARSPSAGLELLLPRLFGDVFGHAAYAGVFGYFLGLAAMKPAHRAKTVLTGLAIACALHASWNAAAGKSSLFMFLIALAGFVMLAVCIIKARQISPERSQLVASQIVDVRPRPATSQPLPPVQALRPQTAQPTAPAATPLPGAAAAAQAPASITWDDDSNQRVLEIGSARIPATVGARLWERQAPGATASRGDGVVAEVNASPNDPAVLGLKNLSMQAWQVTLADGTRRELAPGRSIKLEAGMRLVIGDLVAQVR